MVGLPDQLVVLLKAHKEAQEAERAAARQLWHDEGWVFATTLGRPLNPFTDYREWRALIEEAVPTPTAMAIMGWSSAEMAARYQHVLDSIRKGVAEQIGGLLWGTNDKAALEHGQPKDSGVA